MLVRQIIEILEANYKPDDSIYIEWWDSDIYQDDDAPIDGEVWARAVEIAEDADHSYIHGLVWDMLDCALSEAKEENNE